jgi:Flp pilus assembly pilin Flp
MEFIRSVWENDDAQDVAEYAVMLAVILIIVIGTLKLIGGKSNNVFSQVGSAIG